MLSSTAASESPWEELSSQKLSCFWDWGKQHISSVPSCCGVLSPAITALHALRLELTGAFLSSPGHFQIPAFQLGLTFRFSVDVWWPGKLFSTYHLSLVPALFARHQLQTLQCSYGLSEEGPTLYSFSCAPLPNKPFLLVSWVPHAGWKHQDPHWREEKQ